MQQTIDLNGTWQLRWNDGERGERPKRVLDGEVTCSRSGFEAGRQRMLDHLPTRPPQPHQNQPGCCTRC
jgi:hypothetical protein